MRVECFYYFHNYYEVKSNKKIEKSLDTEKSRDEMSHSG